MSDKPYYIDENGEVYLSLPAILEVLAVSDGIVDQMADRDDMVPGVVTGAKTTLNHLADTFVKIGMMSLRAGVLDEEVKESSEQLIEGIYDYLKEQ